MLGRCLIVALLALLLHSPVAAVAHPGDGDPDYRWLDRPAGGGRPEGRRARIPDDVGPSADFWTPDLQAYLLSTTAVGSEIALEPVRLDTLPPLPVRGGATRASNVYRLEVEPGEELGRSARLRLRVAHPADHALVWRPADGWRRVSVEQTQDGVAFPMPSEGLAVAIGAETGNGAGWAGRAAVLAVVVGAVIAAAAGARRRWRSRA